MKKILLMFAIFSLSSCAAKFTCGQFPQSGCQPVSAVYERSNDGLHDYRKTLFDEKNSAKNGHAGHKKKDVNIHVGEAYRALNYTVPGDPLLSKPVVMRVLFNSWVDKENDLNEGGFVYIRLRESEWQAQP